MGGRCRAARRYRRFPPSRSGDLSTDEVAELLGVTYRQLDYLWRKLRGSPGHGVYRVWTPDDVARLIVARALHRVVVPEDADDGMLWHRLAVACLAGPTPPRRGVAMFADGAVSYPTWPRESDGLAARFDVETWTVPAPS